MMISFDSQDHHKTRINACFAVNEEMALSVTFGSSFRNELISH